MSPEKQVLMEELARFGLGREHLGYVEPLPLVSLEDFFEGTARCSSPNWCETLWADAPTGERGTECASAALPS